MKKKHILSALIVSSTAIFAGCNSKETNQTVALNQDRVANVSVVPVEQQIVTGSQSFPATVVPLNETELRAEVSGYVTNILVADGAYVKKGQKLYEIDRTRYAAEVEQAEATLRIAEANLDRTARDLDRYKVLAEKDAIARQTLDYAETDHRNLQAQVQAAKAALTTANMNLRRSSIIAPFNGTVGISQVRPGALVTAGTTLMNTISSTNPIAVEFQVSELEINRIIQMQRGNTTDGIQIRLPDGQIYQENGKISTVDRAIDRATGTLRVRATFSNDAELLRAGMNLTLSLSNTSPVEENVVPQKAVIEQLGVYNVYVVNDSSKAEYVEVRLGTKFGDKVVIKSGLSKGQKIVVDGANTISNGDKLAINENK